jgi:hypothetical protein
VGSSLVAAAKSNTQTTSVPADVRILTDSYTCQEIDDMVAAGTNGGNVGPLGTCGGTVTVNYYGDGTPRVTFAVGNSCGNGCPFTLDGENAVSCSVSDGE